jgi:predicted AlkP superfamily phosphohydrolase/phosphomutase
MNPGKHGIYHFLNFQEKNYAQKLINSTDIMAPCLWDLLGAQGKKAIVVNVPITYPPKKMNGLLISGMLTPSVNKIFTYPSSLHAEIVAQMGAWPIEKDMSMLEKAGKTYEALDLLFRTTERQLEVLLYLMKKYPWNFLMTVFRGTDLIQHKLWETLSSESSDKLSELEMRLKGIIPIFYEKIDTIIGELVKAVPEDVTVIIMSDHGFGPIKGVFASNRWLSKEGLLRVKRGASWRRLRAKFGRLTLKQILEKLGLDNAAVMTKLSPKALKFKWPVLRSLDQEAWEVIRWSKTKIYGPLGGNPMLFLRLNLKGREPLGVVKPGKEEEALKNFLKEKLLALCNPVTGEKMVEKVYEANEIYSGPYINLAPDLVGEFKNGEYIATGSLANQEWLGESQNAQHRRQGILMIKGNVISQGLELSPCDIMDLTPTILHILSSPIPKDMDGSILEEIFDSTFWEAHPPKFSEPSPLEKEPEPSTEDYNEDEKREITDMLKDLGYID